MPAVLQRRRARLPMALSVLQNMDVPKLCEFTLVSMGHMSAMDGFLLRVLHGSEALNLDAVTGNINH